MGKLRQSAVVAAITRNNGFLQLTADELGCTRQALWLRAQHSQAVREAIEMARERARENRVRSAESAIERLVAKDHFGAARFTLERLAGDRGWAPPVSKSEHTEVSFTVSQIGTMWRPPGEGDDVTTHSIDGDADASEMLPASNDGVAGVGHVSDHSPHQNQTWPLIGE